MNRIQKIATLCVVLLLSSCGIYNRYQYKETVREDLYGTNVEMTVSDSLNFGTWDWKTVFTDAQLQALIDTALVRNVDLRKAHLDIEAAEAMLLSAKLAYLPSFAASPQGSVSYLPSSGTTSTSYNLPISASWEIDVFGKLTNQKRGAAALLDQTREYEQAVRCQLIASVANLYYTLMTLDEQLVITRQTEANYQKSVAITRDLKEAGQSNDVALAQMEATLLSVTASLRDLEYQRAQIENALALLLFETSHPIQPATWEEQQLPEAFPIGIPLTLLANRPDVRMAEAVLAQAFYETNAARSAFYPSLVLSGSGGWTNVIGDMVVDPAKFLGSALASLTQPLFAQGKLTAQLKASKAKQEQATLDFEQALLNAGNEVNEAFMLYQISLSKAVLLEEQVAALKRAADQTAWMMEYGSLTYLEVITAQQSYLSAQLAASANRLEMVQGMISLYSALGGGSDRK